MAPDPASLAPVDRIMAAMPGTLAELAERTGYSIASVLANVTLARRRVRIRVAAQPRTTEGTLPSIYSVRQPQDVGE